MTNEVYVDVDRKGGDDDVFSVRCRNIEANNEQDACEKAEKLCAEKYGEDNVLGAYDARIAEKKGARCNNI